MTLLPDRPLLTVGAAVLICIALTATITVAHEPVAAAGYPDIAAQPVAFGDAGFFGSVAGQTLTQPVVAMAPTPSGRGYWLVGSDGGVFAFGDARFLGSTGGRTLAQPVVDMAPTPSGRGYWLAGSDGAVFAFGDAQAFGSMQGRHLDEPIVAMAADPLGGGYWLVAADGGVFAFGSARFLGSMGAIHLDQPVVGMVPAPFGLGYWLVASDGGVFAFGDARFLGSMGGRPLRQPVVDMAPTPSGGGYWLAASDGGVFAFGDARFLGSMGGQPLPNPVTDVVGTPDGHGYWLLPTTPGANDWAVPGTVLSDLDTAPNSPYGPARKVVALTFDDGPSPTSTPQILQILVADHVPASFQIIGEDGAAFPNLLRQEAADGMSLVNHTWTHVDLSTLPPSAWAAEVDQTDALLQSVTGHPVRCLRPPYGDTDPQVVAQLGRRGLAELSWDVDPSDYLRPGASVIAQRVLSALHPGAIVVMHDGGGDRSQTVGALPSVISGIRAQGYQIVPVCAG